MGNSTIWIIVIMIIGGYFLEKFLRKTKYAKGQCLIYKHVNSLHVKLEIGLLSYIL